MVRFFVVGLLGSLVGVLGILLVIIGCFHCRRKKYLLGSSMILTVLLWIVGVIIFSAFGFDNKFSVLLCVIIAVVSGISTFLCDHDESGSVFKAIMMGFLMALGSIFIVLSMAILIADANGDDHVFYETYTIEVFEDDVKLQYDVERMPAEGYSVIKDKIEDMRESGEVYYEGTVKLKYSCSYPLVRNNHDECSCTDEGLCDICKEYASDVQVVYD